jgi:hypothetical protein
MTERGVTRDPLVDIAAAAREELNKVHQTIGSEALFARYAGGDQRWRQVFGLRAQIQIVQELLDDFEDEFYAALVRRFASVLPDFITDDAKLMVALLRSGRAENADALAKAAGVDTEYAVAALRRMTELNQSGGPANYPVIHRSDLGPDWYEAVEVEDRE